MKINEARKEAQGLTSTLATSILNDEIEVIIQRKKETLKISFRDVIGSINDKYLVSQQVLDGKCRKSKFAKLSIFLTKNASNWRVQCKQTFTTFFGFRLWYTVQNLLGHPVVVDVKNIRTIPRCIWMYWYLRQNVREKNLKNILNFWNSFEDQFSFAVKE